MSLNNTAVGYTLAVKEQMTVLMLNKPPLGTTKSRVGKS